MSAGGVKDNRTSSRARTQRLTFCWRWRRCRGCKRWRTWQRAARWSPWGPGSSRGPQKKPRDKPWSTETRPPGTWRSSRWTSADHKHTEAQINWAGTKSINNRRFLLQQDLKWYCANFTNFHHFNVQTQSLSLFFVHSISLEIFAVDLLRLWVFDSPTRTSRCCRHVRVGLRYGG